MMTTHEILARDIFWPAVLKAASDQTVQEHEITAALILTMHEMIQKVYPFTNTETRKQHIKLLTDQMFKRLPQTTSDNNIIEFPLRRGKTGG